MPLRCLHVARQCVCLLKVVTEFNHQSFPSLLTDQLRAERIQYCGKMRYREQESEGERGANREILISSEGTSNPPCPSRGLSCHSDSRKTQARQEHHIDRHTEHECFVKWTKSWSGSPPGHFACVSGLAYVQKLPSPTKWSSDPRYGLVCLNPGVLPLIAADNCCVPFSLGMGSTQEHSRL